MKIALLIPLLLILSGCVTTLSIGLHKDWPMGDPDMPLKSDISINFTDKE